MIKIRGNKMEEFDTLEKVQKLFEEKNCIGKENNYILLMKDFKKYSGMMDGMQYPYSALLINQTEDGIGYFYLDHPILSLKLSIEKFVINKDSFNFIKNEDIVSIEVKRFSLLDRNKLKSIIIKTKDKKTHYLCSKIKDDTLPYHNSNFAKFLEKYSK